jgi:hypothetical protein
MILSGAERIEAYFKLGSFIESTEYLLEKKEMFDLLAYDVHLLHRIVAYCKPMLLLLNQKGDFSPKPDSSDEDITEAPELSEYGYTIETYFMGETWPTEYWVTLSDSRGSLSICRSFKDLITTKQCFMLSEYFTLHPSQSDVLINGAMIKSVHVR